MTTFFFRFHIYVLAYGICFSLSDLLHSVWQTLGPSSSAHFCSLRLIPLLPPRKLPVRFQPLPFFFFFKELTIYLFIFFGRTARHAGSSLTRDRTHATCSGSGVLTTGPPGKSPATTFYKLKKNSQNLFFFGTDSVICGLSISKGCYLLRAVIDFFF